jgi:hypothetical protein
VCVWGGGEEKREKRVRRGGRVEGDGRTEMHRPLSLRES